ncbi:MAG TPA: tRNA uridine-5-carboxymethylaminomethyl(34) synthesis GTPase MnmE [Epulopiscium sp.]|nr:tRNA uridine-5-carboxymethylaminomethyl(34) synthesis GTPase MnmE [Candidatus Epulonipiscium sp.]
MQLYDTISAISTAPGTGGIGIIRVSGNDAIQIVDKIFKSKSDKKLINCTSHTINYGHIIDFKTDKTIDEVLVMLMKGPKTFTKEDVIEINCHGGPLPVEKVLLATLEAGARLAEPGEFTKRAFLNGRIDLSQAEAIIDVIESKTDRSLSQAIGQLEGNLSKKIKQYQRDIMSVIAQIEVSIDYPEYDIDESENLNYKDEIIVTKQKMESLLSTADTGKMIREGVQTAIIGKPNVGKSSLLNALLQENKAIVTDIPGTTRDIVEAYLNIDGIPFKLLDTAGIRETQDVVEKIGVGLSKSTMEEADLVIMILDSSSELTKEDRDIIESAKGKNIIFVLNKEDLPSIITREIIEKHTEDHPIIYISTKTQKGISELQVAMKTFVNKGQVEVSTEATIANVRHKEALVKAIQSLDKVIETINSGMPEDCMAIDLHDAYGYLGMIIGETIKEEIISELFTRFCLGK